MGLRAVWARMIGWAAGAAALAGCDGVQVDRVDHGIGDPLSYAVPLARNGGLPVDVRGAPFDGVTAEQVVARLRAPGFAPADLTFRMAREGERGKLILVFNPVGAPDPRALCRGRGPGPGAPAEKGFRALGALCNGERMVVTAHLTAREAEAADEQGFVDAMRRLTNALLREKRD